MKTACTAILAAAMAATAAMAEGKVVKDIAYADRTECRLDVRFPEGETNFPTVVWFHGGGLTGGGRHFVPLADEKIAQVAVGYRLLGKGVARGEDCIEDDECSNSCGGDGR